MSATTTSLLLRQFLSWFDDYLKDEGLQFTRCGFKGKDNLGKHAIDLGTGFWAQPTYSLSKPLRWLLNARISDGQVIVTNPHNQDVTNIGHSHTSDRDKVGIAVRLVPLIDVEDGGGWKKDDTLEVVILFVLPEAAPEGGGSEPFGMNIKTGVMSYKGKERKNKEPIDYVFSGLLSLRPNSDIIYQSGGHTVTYGDFTSALANAISVDVQTGHVHPPIYNLTDPTRVASLQRDVSRAFEDGQERARLIAKEAKDDAEEDDEGAAEDDAEVGDDAEDEIPPLSDVLPITAASELIGIDPSVYEQINAALEAGKQHLMFYGPPGTGKTTIAKRLATTLARSRWILLTGSSDWSSQDLIGGYQSVGGTDIKFVPGVLLQHFDKPLIIDEMNRCDIDKVIGPLFTVLSGHQTSMPYRTDIKDGGSAQYVILPKPKPTPLENEFAPGPGWRLIATLNSIDKSSIHQMSYALTRRFGWIYVDAPRDLQGFLRQFVTQRDGAAPPDGTCPLGGIWQAINLVRVIGPAPILDALAMIGKMAPAAPLFGGVTPELRRAVLNAFDMVMLPMLDGITSTDAKQVAAAVVGALDLEGEERERIEARLDSAAV